MISSLALFDWLPQVRGRALRADVLAGVTTAAVVIPKALGYATIAGLPIQVGLYTCLVPAIVYAVLGTSRALSVTTTTTLAILTAAELNEVVPHADPHRLLTAAAALVLLVGAALLLASLLRLGFIANFISEPVLVGFKAGIAAVIVVDQLPKILGIHFAKGSFLHNLHESLSGAAHLSLPTLAIGALTLVSLALVEKIKPQWPAPLIAVALAIAVVAALASRPAGIDLVGPVPPGLPTLTMPDLSLAAQLWPGALGIALMSFTETAAVGKAFAAPAEPSPRPNTELFATGAANAVGAFFGSMPCGGGASQTAVNRLTGARTQVAGLVMAGTALLAMLFLVPLIARMPQAALASIVIFYSVGLIRLADFRAILHIRRTEFIWAIVALLGVALLGTLKGILVAIIVSIFALAQQTANPPVHVLRRKPGTNVFRPALAEHPQDECFPGLLLLRISGRIFFLNSGKIVEKIRPLIAQTHPKVVALDLSGVFDLEYSALKMLIEAERRLRESQVQLWLIGLTPDVFAVVERSSLGAVLGRERLFFNLEIAVSHYLSLQEQPVRDSDTQPSGGRLT